jgi:hypothetical protein
MQGFIVFDYADKYAEARKQLAQWLSEGKLKRKETIIQGGITKSEDALVALFEGKNTGKLSWSQLRSRVANKLQVKLWYRWRTRKRSRLNYRGSTDNHTSSSSRCSCMGNVSESVRQSAPSSCSPCTLHLVTQILLHGTNHSIGRLINSLT